MIFPSIDISAFSDSTYDSNFRAAYKRRLADRNALDPSAVRIKAIRPGSVVVDSEVVFNDEIFQDPEAAAQIYHQSLTSTPSAATSLFQDTDDDDFKFGSPAAVLSIEHHVERVHSSPPSPPPTPPIEPSPSQDPTYPPPIEPPQDPAYPPPGHLEDEHVDQEELSNEGGDDTAEETRQLFGSEHGNVILIAIVAGSLLFGLVSSSILVLSRKKSKYGELSEYGAAYQAYPAPGAYPGPASMGGSHMVAMDEGKRGGHDWGADNDYARWRSSTHMSLSSFFHPADDGADVGWDNAQERQEGDTDTYNNPMFRRQTTVNLGNGDAFTDNPLASQL